MSQVKIASSIAASSDNTLRVHVVGRESHAAVTGKLLSFPKASSVLVSRWYPGYRVATLTGADADETLGMILANSYATGYDLEVFKQTMADPRVPHEVMRELFQRPNNALPARKYQVTEKAVRAVVKEKMEKIHSDLSTEVVEAVSHCFLRVLSIKQLLMTDQAPNIVFREKSYVLGRESIRRAILADSLRDIFAEARIATYAKKLDADATPAVWAEVLANMFRFMSQSIPEVQRKLRYYDIASALVHIHLLDDRRLPVEVRGLTSLVELASYANFIAEADGVLASSGELPAVSDTTMKEACNTVLTIIQSVPSMEALPLSRFAEQIGETPASSPDGVRRGLVVYRSYAQTSKLEVGDRRVVPYGTELAQLAPDYVPISTVAGSISQYLTSVTSLTGLTNLIADEIAADAAFSATGVYSDPVVVSVQLTPIDMRVLAMHLADEISMTKNDSDTLATVNLVYATMVSDQWMMPVGAATPEMAFFGDPAAVILYKSKMLPRDPKPMPSRAQTIGLETMRDRIYLGNMEDMLISSFEKPYSFNIPLETAAGGPDTLKLVVSPLGELLGYDASKYPERISSQYVAVREPGVDMETTLFLAIALAYAEEGSATMVDKAKSWLVDVLGSMMMSPVIRETAVQAIRMAAQERSIDLRTFGAQYRTLVYRAYAGTLLGMLHRYGKITSEQVTSAVQALPASTLSMKAQTVLSTLALAANMRKGV